MTSVYWTDQRFCFQSTDQSEHDDEREIQTKEEREREGRQFEVSSPQTDPRDPLVVRRDSTV